MIKKVLICVIALCVMCSAAFAGIEDGPVAVLEGNDWYLLTNANLLVKEEDDKQYLYDLQLNLLGEGYDSVHDWGDNGIIAENKQGEKTLKGVINYDGSVRVPVRYTDVVCSKGYTNAQAEDGNVVAFGPDGAVLESKPTGIYDFAYIPENDRVIPVNRKLDTESDLYALTDLNGELLTDYLFDTIMMQDFYDYDYCMICSRDDREGLLGIDGTIIFPAEYEEVLDINRGPYETRGIFAAMRDDVLVFSQNGNIVEIPLEDADDVEFYGTCALIEYEDDSYAVARPDGTVQKLDAEDCEVCMVDNDVYFVTEEENKETGEEETVLYDEALNELLRTDGLVHVSSNGTVLEKCFEGTCNLYVLGAHSAQV